MSSITFENRKYRLREVEIDNIGKVNIASTKLNDKLISNEGTYTSNEAILVDEQIYFFVEQSKLKLSNQDLIKHIKKYCI